MIPAQVKQVCLSVVLDYYIYTYLVTAFHVFHIICIISEIYSAPITKRT